jgi:hypothetical protein
MTLNLILPTRDGNKDYPQRTINKEKLKALPQRPLPKFSNFPTKLE